MYGLNSLPRAPKLMFLGEKNWAIRYAPATNNINALAEKSAEAFLRLEANWK